MESCNMESCKSVYTPVGERKVVEGQARRRLDRISRVWFRSGTNFSPTRSLTFSPFYVISLTSVLSFRRSSQALLIAWYLSTVIDPQP
ncbi:ABC transporter ATP-binding protein [Sesbania bispinosa]|nr:ABC transporter ATP-binding protein [Sesbania bispinosa]